MRTQISVIREYATGLVDGFMCDLVLATERHQGPKIDSEDALIEAFKSYAANPNSLFAAKVAA